MLDYDDRGSQELIGTMPDCWHVMECLILSVADWAE